MKNKQFEYCEIILMKSQSREGITTLGKLGWEMVSASPIYDTFAEGGGIFVTADKYYFKREIINEE